MKTNLKRQAKAVTNLKRNFVTAWVYLLGVFFVLAGCENIINNPETGTPQGAAGNVVVSIDSGAERSLMPDTNGLGITQYVLTFSGSGSHGPETTTLGALIRVSLAPGNWTITAQAKAGATVKAEGTWAGMVNANETTSVSITLLPKIGSGTGTLAYTVTFPSGGTGTLTLNSVTETGPAGADDPVSLTSGQAGTKTLAAGFYRLNIRIQNASGQVAGIAEAVHVYAGLTTSANYTFAAGDFGDILSPSAPRVSAGNAQLTVTWEAVSGAAAYAVYHGTSDNSASAVQFGADVSATTVTITGLTNGTLYYVWVKAKNADGNTSGFSPSTSGKPGNLITTAAGLQGISMTGSYALGADITLTNWTPLGSEASPFKGSLEGNGYTINLQGFSSTALSSNTYVGIFAYMKGDSASAKAEIKNLRINSTVNASSSLLAPQNVGLVTGNAENAVIDRVTLSGSFGYQSSQNNSSQVVFLGGVAGRIGAGAVIKDSTSAMSMDIRPSGGGSAVYNYIGGFVGMFSNGGGIENCHNTAAVSATSTVAASQVFVGGIANSEYSMNTGYRGYIIDCSSTGNITGSAMGSWTYVGGIAATLVGDGGDMANDSNTTRMLRCYASGIIDNSQTSSGFPYIGGIVAYNYYGALVSQCYFSGTVQGKTATYTGGIAGYNSQTTDHNSRIEDCYVAGAVNLGGGVVGQNQVNAYIRRCYSRAPGKPIAGSNANTAEDAIANCVTLEDYDPKPAKAYYEGLGWNFSTVWKMGGDGYPHLQWE
jgi:hypothetical protein